MIQFMRYRFWYYLVSLLIIVPGMYYLVRFGLSPSIDFTGGSIIEVRLTVATASAQPLGSLLKENKIEVECLQSIGTDSYLFKMKPITKEKNDEILTLLKTNWKGVEQNRFETVGPIFGKELLKKTLTAAFLAVVVILLYIAWAFHNWRFGMAAILALIHDVLVVIGVFALLGHWYGVEVDVLFVTAILTTMSFSVHDTIVVFDRIRELQKKAPHMELVNRIDQALSATMVRSLNNSLTIIFMLTALFLLGGQTIRWFVFALLIGTISGSYSSPFVATPILYDLEKWKK